jgi:hypothetical protein
MNVLTPVVAGGDYKYAEQVYGKAGDQHAAPGGGNVIAMKPASGGRKSRKDKKGGMNQQMLVPLALVAANTFIKGRKSQKGGFEPEPQPSSLQPTVFGGKMLEELAAPVALVMANNTLKRRSRSNKRYKKSKKQYRKSRSTRRRR